VTKAKEKHKEPFEILGDRRGGLRRRKTNSDLLLGEGRAKNQRNTRVSQKEKLWNIHSRRQGGGKPSVEKSEKERRTQVDITVPFERKRKTERTSRGEGPPGRGAQRTSY